MTTADHSWSAVFFVLPRNKENVGDFKQVDYKKTCELLTVKKLFWFFEMLLG